MGSTVIRTPVLLPNIQVLRGLAALMVVVAHLAATLVHANMPNPLPDLSVGNFGVDLFFVISGFIMFHVAGHDAGAAAAGRFLVRRLARIVPTYWLVTSLALVLMLRDYGSTPISQFQQWHVLASYLFIPFREIQEQDGVYPIVAVGWTLQYEMFFYACFASVILLAPRLKLIVLAGGFVAIACAGLVFDLPLPVSFWADPIILEFVFGLIVAWVLSRDGGLTPRCAAGLVMGALAGFWLYTAYLGGTEDSRALGWGLPAAALVAAAAIAPRCGWPMLSRGLEGLGNASYSLYLLHGFVYDGMLRVCRGAVLAHRMQYRLLLPLMLIAALSAALAFYRFVERPLTRAIQKHLVGRTPTASAELPALSQSDRHAADGFPKR